MANPKAQLGLGTNTPCVDSGTLARVDTTDRGFIGKYTYYYEIGYVGEAWDRAKRLYVKDAILRHTADDFQVVVQGILPSVLVGVGFVLMTTIVGAIVGAMGAGAGAAPGAVAGAAFGISILNWLGIGFLVVYLGERLTLVSDALYSGASRAFNSNGNPAEIDAAAVQLAEGVGLIHGLIMQGVLAMVVGKGLSKSIEMLMKNKWFGPPIIKWLLERQRTGRLPKPKTPIYRPWSYDVDLWLADLTKPYAGAAYRQNLKIALEFLGDPKRSLGGKKVPFRDWDVDTQISYINGIDFHKPVTIRTIREGEELVRFGFQGSQGNYFSRVGASPERLGIKTDGKAFMRYRATKSFDVLDATAAEWKSMTTREMSWGRGRQYVVDDSQLGSLVKIHEGPPRLPAVPAPGVGITTLPSTVGSVVEKSDGLFKTSDDVGPKTGPGSTLK
jgi:hypothetical protein